MAITSASAASSYRGRRDARAAQFTAATRKFFLQSGERRYYGMAHDDSDRWYARAIPNREVLPIGREAKHHRSRDDRSGCPARTPDHTSIGTPPEKRRLFEFIAERLSATGKRELG
jgi:hypothetical protein